MIEIHSKLPAQGVTIFSIMTAMAQRLTYNILIETSMTTQLLTMKRIGSIITSIE
ncbi:hypothetical protein P7L54_18505 [Acinetobacter bereziniae]|uniref:hypothetical protein n=1 Tax=Acinetobacter bereziniae TaxID=106648 RepID=UPI0002F90EEB|nr:hypothetical protein [Acinetobacter bereziniae]MBJ9906905.1 hypothetical protein [Acinetobacter bereziniae]MBJ9928407.1 hypothetical protein [Acinetobacter bereziniae]MCU4434649.1 hypothetical protein [Acinetobacter bereziniae]MCU4539475.1 hypothetical protein [Acinetobacter bereziniae]MDG3557934.1 hypothetical protein [Acinetobacter bereziniae]